MLKEVAQTGNKERQSLDDHVEKVWSESCGWAYACTACDMFFKDRVSQTSLM